MHGQTEKVLVTDISKIHTVTAGGNVLRTHIDSANIMVTNRWTDLMPNSESELCFEYSEYLNFTFRLKRLFFGNWLNGLKFWPWRHYFTGKKYSYELKKHMLLNFKVRRTFLTYSGWNLWTEEKRKILLLFCLGLFRKRYILFSKNLNLFTDRPTPKFVLENINFTPDATIVKKIDKFFFLKDNFMLILKVWV